MSAWRSWRMVPLYLTLVLIALAGGLWASHVLSSTSGVAITGGLLAGILLGTAQMLRRPTPKLALAVLALALAVLALLWVLLAEVLIAAAIIAGGLCLGWYALWNGWVTRTRQAEVRSEVIELGGEGTAGRALIVHHPGRSGFHTRLQRAFADGLMSRGWRVAMTTASTETPIDLLPFELLVLGAPVYNWRAAQPVLAYISRLGDMRGKPVALVLSGGGVTDAAMVDLRRRVGEARGRVVEALEVWTERPNMPRHGLGDPEEVLRRAAARITVAPDNSAATPVAAPADLLV